jgi:hypothetical protein
MRLYRGLFYVSRWMQLPHQQHMLWPTGVRAVQVQYSTYVAWPENNLRVAPLDLGSPD